MVCLCRLLRKIPSICLSSLRKVNRTSLWRCVSPSIARKIMLAILQTASARAWLKGRYALGIYTMHAEFLPIDATQVSRPGKDFHQVLLCSAFSTSVGLLATLSSTLFKPETIWQAHSQGFSWWKPTYVHWFPRHSSWNHLKIRPQKFNLFGLLSIPLLLLFNLQIVLPSDCTSWTNLSPALLHFSHIALLAGCLMPQ